jgi:hypothetical protein
MSVPLFPPNDSITLSTPRKTADRPFFKPSPRSVVAATNFKMLRKLFTLGAPNAGALIIKKSCVDMPSDPARRSPSTPITFNASPRGRETESSRMSPGVVENLRTIG